LVAEYPILIIYYYQTAKTRALCESPDRPDERTADNTPNSNRLKDYP
jgi:hypothetical protein